MMVYHRFSTDSEHQRYLDGLALASMDEFFVLEDEQFEYCQFCVIESCPVVRGDPCPSKGGMQDV